MGKNNADLVIVDAFYKADQPLTKAEVNALKHKFMGARRLVLAEIDLSVARDDRFYWKSEWRVGEPAFLREPQPGIPTGILVNYWDPAWKEILGTHFKGLMDLGFDGVMIDDMNAVTYSSLKRLSDLLAAAFANLMVEPGSRVATTAEGCFAAFARHGVRLALLTPKAIAGLALFPDPRAHYSFTLRAAACIGGRPPRTPIFGAARPWACP